MIEFIKLQVKGSDIALFVERRDYDYLRSLLDLNNHPIEVQCASGPIPMKDADGQEFYLTEVFRVFVGRKKEPKRSQKKAGGD